MSGRVEAGEHVAVNGQVTGVVTMTGLPFPTSFVHVWTVRDGRIARAAMVLDHEAVLTALRPAPRLAA